MGKVDIELEALLKEPKRRSRSWHKLEAVDGKSSNVTGELDVVVQWRYNPALDFDPWYVLPHCVRHRRDSRAGWMKRRTRSTPTRTRTNYESPSSREEA